MVRIGTVWDRTVEVIGGRTNMLAGIAVATLLVPTIVRDAVSAFATKSGGVAVAAGILSIAVVAIMLFGQLALTAVSSDPATTRGDAYAIARARLGAALLVAVIAIVVVLVASIPAGVLLANAGYDFSAAAAGRPQTTLSPGAIGGAGLYLIVLGVVAMVVGSRLSVLWPVIVNERLGLAAFGRAWRLTKGMTWKLIAVGILYAIVLIVALTAATAITGVVFPLILGADNPALVTFLASLAGAIVTTVFAVLQTMFVTQLYVALRAREEGIAAAPAA